MMVYFDKKLMTRLDKIRNKIAPYCEAIHQAVEKFLSENQTNLSHDKINDIKKIDSNSLLLKKRLDDLLLNDLKEQIFTQNDLSAYLANIRHNLCNPVNIIQGYSEILLEEFQETENAEYITTFSKLITKVHKISKLINEIRFYESESHSLPIETDYTEVAHKTIENAEYYEFKKTISFLIVDDIYENCDILKRILNNMGYKNTQIAHNGLQALDMLNKDKFDIMLLDVDMPGMTGIEILLNLKEKIVRERFMVLMISSFDATEGAIKCIKLGAEDFLTKPFNPNLLRVRIESCVEKKWFFTKEKLYRTQLRFEKQRYQALLRAIFPPVIEKELAETGQVQARVYKNVALLFADVVNFTSYCDTHEPAEIIKYLQELAEMCEILAAKNNLLKIKTIGDSFLGVGGMLSKSENPVLDCLNSACDLIEESKNLTSKWQLRVGIHLGPVVGGIVGHRQFLFDIWGDTVNTTSRIQQLAQPGTIYMSKTAWLRVQDKCHARSLGKLEIKGKNAIEVFVCERRY